MTSLNQAILAVMSAATAENMVASVTLSPLQEALPTGNTAKEESTQETVAAKKAPAKKPVAKKAPAKKPAAKKPAGPTLEDVAARVRSACDDYEKADVKEIISSFDVAKVSDLDESKYAEFLETMNEVFPID